MSQSISTDEVISILIGLRNEFARKAEEIWSRGLEYGYEGATSEHDKVVYALRQAIEALQPKEESK